MEQTKGENMRNLIIVGAGGVGRETVWIVEQINQRKETFNILGFVDDNKDLWEKEINGYKVLGGLNYLLEKKRDTNIIISIANYKIKKDFAERLRKYEFETIIHPDVYIHKTIEIGKGTIIYPGTIMTTNISIGNHVIICAKTGIGHDTKIEDYVSILWNVNISGFDVIKEGAFIGSNATIIQNLNLEGNTTIGAATLILRDIEEKSKMVGVPARRI